MNPSEADVDRRARRGHDARVETWVGAGLLAFVALCGLYYAVRPASGTIDGWFLDLIGGSKNAAYRAVTATRQPWVVVAGSVVACAVTVLRDRPRALACLVGPPAALLACELVAKPLVGRTLGGALSFPSGSTVGAAALACAAVLATPSGWRTVTVVLGSLYALWMAVAVVGMRWHFPTDALAGLAMGVGTVLLADGLAWYAADLIVRARRRRIVPARGG